MKKSYLLLVALFGFLIFTAESCGTGNKTAKQEQEHIEKNQSRLNETQPSPSITWSLERDNLIKRFKLMNDRSLNFYMYIFIEGIAQPVGYYQINKVSSVNSQLTAMQQIITVPNVTGGFPIESPAEDGSYGSNGDGVFGFTPEDIYIETNCKYIVASVPLTFQQPVNRLAVVSGDEMLRALENSKKVMNKKD